jgi:hypothetical protein
MVLGARLLPADAAARVLICQDALKLARDLLRRILERAHPHPGLSANVRFHVGKAMVRGPANAPVIVDGDVLAPASWQLTAGEDGVRITREGAAGLKL